MKEDERRETRFIEEKMERKKGTKRERRKSIKGREEINLGELKKVQRRGDKESKQEKRSREHETETKRRKRRAEDLFHTTSHCGPASPMAIPLPFPPTIPPPRFNSSFDSLRQSSTPVHALHRLTSPVLCPIPIPTPLPLGTTSPFNAFVVLLTTLDPHVNPSAVPLL